MIQTERLRAKAAGMGIEVSPELSQRLDEYAQLLAEWNEKINLTAITQPEEVEDKHFLDSLVLASQPEVADSLADVGSGAGFPGLVAGLYKPELRLTLIEPLGKRVKFLADVCEKLHIAADLENQRAEDAAQNALRERFACVTARAVSALPALCEYCLPLVQVGGWFIAMKGEAAEEVAAAQKAIEQLGGKWAETRAYSLPDGSARSLIVVQKVSKTPAKYPRNNAQIKKKAL